MGSRVCSYLRPMRVMALLALAFPAAAWGLGLGPIRTDTRIGQNFTAQIPIVGASSNDLQGLTVGLASPDDYKNAGLSEPDYLFSLKFTVESGPSGPYVQVTSSQPVRLPFLSLLVHANWSSGEVTRQYTVLLNPPMFVAGTQAAPVSAPVAPPPAGRPVTRNTPPPPVKSAPAGSTGAQSYGPVPHGATLWGLAHQLRPSASISINQMMIALYNANPDAFVGNINRLKAGYVLRIPSRDEIAGVSTAEATRMVAEQNSDWRQWRSSGGMTTVVASQPAPSAPGGNVQTTGGAPSAATVPVVSAATSIAGNSASSGTGRVLLTTPEVTGVGTVAASPGTAVAGAATAAGSAMATTAGSGSAAAIASASTAGPAKLNSELGALAQSRAGAAAAGSSAVSNVTNVVSPAQENRPGGLMGWVTSPKGWIVAGVIILLLILIAYLLRRRAAAAPVISAAERSRARAGGGPGTKMPAAPAARAEAAVEAGEGERAPPRPERATTVAAAAEAPAHETAEEDEETDRPVEAAAGHDESDIDLDLALEQPAESEEAQGEPLDFERIVDELSTFIETYVPGGGEAEPEEEAKPAAEPDKQSEAEASENIVEPPAVTEPAPLPHEEVLELSPEEEDAILGRGSDSADSDETADIDAAAEDPVNTKLDLARAYVDLGDPESARGLLEEVLDEGDDPQRVEAQRLLDSLG